MELTRQAPGDSAFSGACWSIDGYDSTLETFGSLIAVHPRSSPPAATKDRQSLPFAAACLHCACRGVLVPTVPFAPGLAVALPLPWPFRRAGPWPLRWLKAVPG